MIVYLAAIRTPLGLWPASLAKCNSGVFPVGIHRTAVALVVMKPSYARQCERLQRAIAVAAALQRRPLPRCFDVTQHERGGAAGLCRDAGVATEAFGATVLR